MTRSVVGALPRSRQTKHLVLVIGIMVAMAITAAALWQRDPQCT